MATQFLEAVPAKSGEEFSRPVESIMRCEDFKSNFARRLSNRYISRSPVVSPRQDTTLKLRPYETSKAEIQDNVLERIELSSQLSKSNNLEQNGEAVKPPDKPLTRTSDIRSTEVTALNMEVETLRWQLAQTEANRQMHIALLKQIVSFLNRVKEHIECQRNEPGSKKDTHSAMPRPFNFTDLPRSRSVVHVNKSIDYSLTPSKKISTKKISKSISNVNGFKDYSGIWSQSKLSLTHETENGQKISEEMSRLITLANTVLSTKLPDLACTCLNNVEATNMAKVTEATARDLFPMPRESNISLNSIEENIVHTLILTPTCDVGDKFDGTTDKYLEGTDKNVGNIDIPLHTELENYIPVDENEHNLKKQNSGLIIAKTKTVIDKKNDFNLSNFIEDESGFSSMSSFQEIGIPIISIIPPSPCKEMAFLENIPDITDASEKWKTDTMELEKQTMNVFWV